jgi:hypothetical protein
MSAPVVAPNASDGCECASDSPLVPAVVAAASNGVGDEFPQFDGSALGLPKDFILYAYNRLKG